MSIQGSMNQILGSVSGAITGVSKALDKKASEALKGKLAESEAQSAQYKKEVEYLQKRAGVKERGANKAIKEAKAETEAFKASASKEQASALAGQQKEYENRLKQQRKGYSDIDNKIRKELLKATKGNKHAQSAIVLAYARRQARINAFERAQAKKGESK